MAPVDRIGRTILSWEARLAYQQTNDDPERTLFVQLTPFESVLVQYGLWWIAQFHGGGSVLELVQKIHECVKAQGFCDCDDCRAEREEEDGS